MHEHKYPVLTQEFMGKQLIYFDAACTYLRGTDFVENASEYYDQFSTCAWDRESSYMGSLLTQRIEQVRKDMKIFLNASAWDTVVFTASTTDAINMVAHGTVRAIGTFITSDIEHNSNYLPWLETAKKNGKSCLVVPYKTLYNPQEFRNVLESIQSPFIVALTHASNITWEIFDIAPVAQLVHEFGGYIFVDDAQFVPHHREDVLAESIDFLAFSAHKLWWPTGIGALYIRQSCRDLIQDSIRIWWWTIQSLHNWEPHYKSLPEFLEWWVQNFAWILGFGQVIKKRIAENDERYEYVQGLMKYFYTKLEACSFSTQLQVISNPEGTMITICPTSFHAIDFHQYCNYFFDGYIIAFRTGSFCADTYVNTYLWGEKNIMRFSFWVYNTSRDIDILFQALTQFIAWAKQ